MKRPVLINLAMADSSFPRIVLFTRISALQLSFIKFQTRSHPAWNFSLRWIRMDRRRDAAIKRCSGKSEKLDYCSFGRKDCGVSFLRGDGAVDGTFQLLLRRTNKDASSALRIPSWNPGWIPNNEAQYRVDSPAIPSISYPFHANFSFPFLSHTSSRWYMLIKLFRSSKTVDSSDAAFAPLCSRDGFLISLIVFFAPRHVRRRYIPLSHTAHPG